MAFSGEDIRRDHWNKTHAKRSGGKSIVRDICDIKEPQGKKFLQTQILGIPNYTRIDNPRAKGGVVLRRRVSKA